MKQREAGAAGVLMAVALIAGCVSEGPGDAVAVKDYVSEYDFDNALLEDLPWEMAAAIVGPSAVLDYAPFVARHYPDWNYIQYCLGQDRFIDLSYIPAGSTNDIHVVDDPVAVAVEYRAVDPRCRLTAGELAGELRCVDGVVRLDTNAPQHIQLSVEVLGYEDVNGDGYMDVLLRRSLPGSACPVEDLVLSRKRLDGMFYVVEITERRIRQADQEAAGLEPGWNMPVHHTDDAHGNAQIHLVYPGETVSVIARQYGVSEDALRTANDLSSEDQVLAGQRLRVPGL